MKYLFIFEMFMFEINWNNNNYENKYTKCNQFVENWQFVYKTTAIYYLGKHTN